MFDEYKVTKLKVSLEPQFVTIETIPNGAVIAEPVEVYTMVDYDDFNRFPEVNILNSGKVPRNIASGKVLNTYMSNIGRRMYKGYYNTTYINALPQPGSAPASNFGTVPPSGYGSLKVFIPNTVVSTVAVRVIATWTVHFTGLNGA